MVKYMDGNIKVEKNGKFEQNEYGIPTTINRVGYPDAYKHQIVDPEPDKFRVKSKEELEQRK